MIERNLIKKKNTAFKFRVHLPSCFLPFSTRAFLNNELRKYTKKKKVNFEFETERFLSWKSFSESGKISDRSKKKNK